MYELAWREVRESSVQQRPCIDKLGCLCHVGGGIVSVGHQRVQLCSVGLNERLSVPLGVSSRILELASSRGAVQRAVQPLVGHPAAVE